MVSPVKLQVDKCGDICIIKLAGDLDHFHASYLREALLDLIDQGYSKVILDMSDIAFMDSSGMSVLISWLSDW
jgi:anti-sigma B factor antagonist